MFPDSGGSEVLNGRQVDTTDFLCSPVCVLNQTVWGGQRIGSAGLDQELPRQLRLPELLQEVHPRLGLFDDSLCFGRPLQV